MVQKPELIAFAQYRLGGVQNFYYNLLSHLPEDTFDITWILDDSSDKANAPLPKPYGVCSEIIFKSDEPAGSSPLEKFDRLQQLISDRPGLVVTNFYLELGTLHTHRRRNKTIYFMCHDELYLLQAAEYEFLIDVYIAHNPHFYKRLREMFPHREKDIFYLPYGIELPAASAKTFGGNVRIVFAARMVKAKGISDLPGIIRLVREAHPNVEWLIMGDGPLRGELMQQLQNTPNVTFAQPKDNAGVRELMADCHIFILPSYLDGLPVAMLEAMSVGCVPVLYRFNEGIGDILDATEGYIVPSGDQQAFADAINTLCSDKALLRQMSAAARRKVEDHYNIHECARNYAQLFLRYAEFKKPIHRKFIAYGGLLEQRFIPGFVRKSLRRLKTTRTSK